MIEKFLRLFESFSTRLANIEVAVTAMVKKVSNIEAATASPDGHMTFGGVIRTSPDAIKQAFHGRSLMHLELIELDVQFGHSIYAALRPEAKAKIKELLDVAQLEHLKNALWQHKRLDTLLIDAEARVEALRMAQSVFSDESKSAIDMKAREVSLRVDERIGLLEGRLTDRMARLDKALDLVGNALRDAKAAAARSQYLLQSQAPTDGGIATKCPSNTIV